MEANLNIMDKVKSFILENFLFETSDASLNSSESLVDSGVIDSTGVLELVSFLEEEFGIEVKDDELIPDYFDSLDRITAYIEKKT
jgi:acyl carrier protein